jgi:hypothetical protein
MNDSLQRAIPSQPQKINQGNNRDIISTRVLFEQSFMGPFSTEQIVDSIRKVRQEFKEPKFMRFGGRD